MPRFEALEATIASLACQLSGVGGSVDPRTPFAVLGLDSLATVELAAAIERATGLDLPPEVVADCANAQALAARLRDRADALLDPADPFELMLADAVLPDDVRPPARAVHASPASLRDARCILLTGATGFLGRWLARELLDRSEATLLCLVRTANSDARRRLHESLGRAGIGCDRLDRIEIVEGDLSQPRLGLTRGEADRLASRVDAICHAGASVNWIHPYASLRAANVLGTLELLRIASGRGRPFHFVSSVSVCYSTTAPTQVDETFDPLPHTRGVHLGYACTKIVSESLVRQAGARGLPVSINRPALKGGHSGDRDFNADDLLTLLVRGCVRMGVAPDLDWTLDVLPVECVARRIVALSHVDGICHLIHARPRHWRECVLWMRLYGYPLELISYASWVHRLERDLEAAADRGERHPLAPLRRFFSERPAGAEGLTLPQLYENVRRTHALGDRTDTMLVDGARQTPELDAALLHHYFQVFQTAGQLDPPAALSAPMTGAPSNDAGSPRTFGVGFFVRAIGDGLGAIEDVRLLTQGSQHSIISDLTAWRSSRPTGLFDYRLHTSTGTRDVVVKVKPLDRDVMAVGEAVARLCDQRIGDAYTRWQDRIGVALSHVREIQVYRQTDRQFVRHLPSLLGSIADERDGLWAMVLERVPDATANARRWDRSSIAVAIAGLASLQSVWYRREHELRSLPWIGFERSARSMAEMTDLWSALAAHARPAFCAWADPTLSSIHRRLVASVADWWRPLESGPRTLIHNDFNPRNICLRRDSSDVRLCAYDWELATIGAPQRDLAEFLCFVLSQDAERSEVDAWIEFHRVSLERETNRSIDCCEWVEGFRSALYDVLIDRLTMYALIHRIRRQPFLPRIVRTWLHLYRMFPLPEDA